MKKAFLIIFIFTGINVFVVKSISLFSEYPDLAVKKSIVVIDQQQKKDSTVKVIYTCPMHSEITRDKPGKCPKCGMNLVAKEIKKDVYNCPMHPEISQDKPGKCPKCGMNLVKKEAAKKTDTREK